jgi:hypothetical protein
MRVVKVRRTPQALMIIGAKRSIPLRDRQGEGEGRRKRGVLDSDTDGSFAIRREENTRDWCPDKSSSIVCQDRGEEALSKHGGSSGWVVASFGEVIEEQPVHDEGRAIRRQTLRRNWRGGCRVRRRRVRSRGQT